MSDGGGPIGPEELRSGLTEILGRTVPDFEQIESLDRLSGGASQETYRLRLRAGGEERLLALRRAPGGQSGSAVGVHPGLATEALILRHAREAGIPEPEIHYVLEEGDGLGDGFLMEWLEGETLGPRIVRSPELAEVRTHLAFECGQILARIHALDLDATGLRYRLQELSAQDFVDQTYERYRSLGTPQPMIDFVARWLYEHLPKAAPRALVHNDFRIGNLMVDPNGIVAVLDWEISHIGDPMRDLGWICTNSWRFGGEHPVGGCGSREQLFAGYESISGELVDPEHVRFWEVFGSFWWATGTLGMAQYYRTGPDNSVERAAIGRRTSECQVDCVNLLIPGRVELLEAVAPASNLDMPRIDELLESSRDFLRQEVLPATRGRTSFLARVAGNALDIVLRELALGPEHRRREGERLRHLLVSDEDDLEKLRWELIERIRDGRMPLDDLELTTHLRQTVVQQIAIDQPRYSGLRRALGQIP